MYFSKMQLKLSSLNLLLQKVALFHKFSLQSSHYLTKEAIKLLMQLKPWDNRYCNKAVCFLAKLCRGLVGSKTWDEGLQAGKYAADQQLGNTAVKDIPQ